MSDFYMEGDPTNEYVTSQSTPLAIIWDETTQTGDSASFYFDDGVSLTFVQTSDVVIGEYEEVGLTTGYAFLTWDTALGVGDVVGTITFYRWDPTDVGDPFKPIIEYSNTNADYAGGTTQLLIQVADPVRMPASSVFQITMFITGAHPTTVTIDYSEMLMHYEDAGRKWWVGVAGWTG